MRPVKIFDTTLRDGEQSPGCSMNIGEKVEVAHQLEKLGVDIIEAGFASSSKGDFESVKRIAETVKEASVCSLARAVASDIKASAEALAGAADPVLHIFLSTSDLHLQSKLNKTREQALEMVEESVRYAKSFCGKIEFSAEDATRSDPDFLVEIVTAALKNGATTINIPDTVGYATPDEFRALLRYLYEHTELDKALLSVHCHNDLGLAVANSLAAIKAGASQIECTVNGIGERAGNASLEEIVMNLYTRRSEYDAVTNIDTKEIFKTSKLIQLITGVTVAPTKPVVGKNAFLHESGIHQHGVMNNPLTYEIFSPETIGVRRAGLVLGKHSGKHAFFERVRALGYSDIPEQQAEQLFTDFKNLADKKKEIHDDDIVALILKDIVSNKEHIYKLDRFVITCGDKITDVASVSLIVDGKRIENVASGDGPIDAAFNAIEKTTGRHFTLEDFHINAVTGGRDAQGTAKIRLRYGEKETRAIGISTDIIEASIFAYLNAVNFLLSME